MAPKRVGASILVDVNASTATARAARRCGSMVIWRLRGDVATKPSFAAKDFLCGKLSCAEFDAFCCWRPACPVSWRPSKGLLYPECDSIPLQRLQRDTLHTCNTVPSQEQSSSLLKRAESCDKPVEEWVAKKAWQYESETESVTVLHI